MQLDSLSFFERLELLRLLEEQQVRTSRRRFFDLFPDHGPLRRDLYQKHLAFFKAGFDHDERLFMAANRIGKTLTGAYEMTCHLTGRYPHWWPGRRFDEPVQAWAAGTTNETTRDIVQKELFGGIDRYGTGMIPFADLIGDPRYRPNTNKAIDYAMVRHVSGGTSSIGLKSYEQRRKAFEGTARHVIWLDEEPPLDIYSECLLRTATVEGIIYVTFTPLEGATEVVRSFIDGAEHRV